LTTGGLRRGRTNRPRASLVLTASELGAYTFCPQAWYLQRHEHPRSRVGEERLSSGAAAHRSIGERVDRLRAIEAARGLVLVGIISALVLLILGYFAAVGLP
jgi:hypothetical protein